MDNSLISIFVVKLGFFCPHYFLANSPDKSSGVHFNYSTCIMVAIYYNFQYVVQRDVSVSKAKISPSEGQQKLWKWPNQQSIIFFKRTNVLASSAT